MSDVYKMTEITVLPRSTGPLVGIVQINTTDKAFRFEITEELAHRICTELERFLTQDD